MTAADRDREAFEAWMREEHPHCNLVGLPGGEYVWMVARFQWKAWQAARAQAEPVAVPAGFVLVPIDPSHKKLCKLGHEWACNAEEAAETYATILEVCGNDATAASGRDHLPRGHVILEQADMLDGRRVSQTVRATDGSEYERIVHADEAYGAPATPVSPPAESGEVERLREALERMVLETREGPNYRPSAYALKQAEEALASTPAESGETEDEMIWRISDALSEEVIADLREQGIDPEAGVKLVDDMAGQAKALASTPAPQPGGAVKQRVLERISVFASCRPETDESWESWYHAAFDMLASEVAALSPSPSGWDAGAEEHHKLDTARQVFFYEQDFYVLSNFSAFTLVWKGHLFDTSEAAYHWEKFIANDPGVAYLIRKAPSAHEAFKIAERYRSVRRSDWDAVKIDIMRDILRAKAAQHEYVRRKLLATGDRELIEDSWRDAFWGWGPNRDGQNMLGKIWMEVRAELRALPTPPAGEEK